MQAIRIGQPKELEKHVIKEHKIVALYEIHEYTVCVRSHALRRFHERSNPEKINPKRPSPTRSENYLNEIHSMLVRSELAKHRLGLGWVKKYRNQRIAYRFAKGWIFVLEWEYTLKVWLLKTTFPKASSNKKAYKIMTLPEHELPLTWDPFHGVMHEA